MNDHKIHGRLARDPDFTPGEGDKCDRVNITVAVDRRFGDETDFFDCVMFGSRARVIDKFFSKGSEILTWGEGQIRSYTDKDGIKRKAYSIVLENFDFCGSKNSASNNQSYAEQNAVNAANIAPEDVPDSMEAAEDDIPF